MPWLWDPSHTLEGNSRKSSESVSGVFPEFVRKFFQKVDLQYVEWGFLQRVFVI